MELGGLINPVLRVKKCIGYLLLYMSVLVHFGVICYTENFLVFRFKKIDLFHSYQPNIMINVVPVVLRKYRLLLFGMICQVLKTFGTLKSGHLSNVA